MVRLSSGRSKKYFPAHYSIYDASSPFEEIDNDGVTRYMFNDCWSFLVAFAWWCRMMLVSLGGGV